MRPPVTWIRGPELAPDGPKDHLVFVHATEMLYRNMNTGDKDSLSNLYDDFVYLLLQKNQLTGEEHLMDNPVDPSVKSERYNTLVEVFKRDVENCLETGSNLRPYALLQLIQLVSVNIQEFGELPTILALACWLLTKNVERSVDPVICQRCARIYSKSRSVECSPSDLEFTSTSSVSISAISVELDRLFSIYSNLTDIVEEVSCLGCFSSLVRACRMVGRDDPLNEYLRGEFAWINSLTTR